MKRIIIMLTAVCIFMVYDNTNEIKAAADEVIIESIHESDKEENSWENRPLIQTTSYEEEYLGAVRLGAFTMPKQTISNSETLYEQASRCIVRIVSGQYAGSGLIWCMEEEGMVIASNKHLLQESTYGTVTFSNEISVRAEVMGYSQDYDIGFLFLSKEQLTADVLRSCYEVRAAVKGQNTIQPQKQIIQLASSGEAAGDFYEGEVIGQVFVPEFQSFMLETRCYAKAGMSGGGVFDKEGFLLGMIAGGRVTEYAAVRESEITYSIPVEVLEAEYQKIWQS